MFSKFGSSMSWYSEIKFSERNLFFKILFLMNKISLPCCKCIRSLPLTTTRMDQLLIYQTHQIWAINLWILYPIFRTKGWEEIFIKFFNLSSFLLSIPYRVLKTWVWRKMKRRLTFWFLSFLENWASNFPKSTFYIMEKLQKIIFKIK